MRLAYALFLVAIIVAFAATCSRSDELKCPPGERPYHCRMECMARPCDSPFTYEPRVAETMLCAADVMDAIFKFGEAVRQYDVKDCTPPDCRAVQDTGSALMPTEPAGATYHEQVEAEGAVGATGGWDPWPGGSGCVP